MKPTIDDLVFHSVFAKTESEKQEARKIIRDQALSLGIIPSSLHHLYVGFGKNEIKGFTVPAINIRTLTYDTARLIFQLMNSHAIGPVIFEIARSEIEYTEQRPDEYSSVILAAAIKESYVGPVFLQGDHFQLSKNKFSLDEETEINKIKSLIKESIAAQFYNIDIDASTLVDLTKASLEEQQKNNYRVTSILTEYIRSLQPKNTIISIGGEIGHIGGKNSTEQDFEAFMSGYLELTKQPGISKVSVQTGSSHGGIPLPDGSMAQVKLDFNVLKTIGEVARTKYRIGGAVQHGASTLPQDLFDTFPQMDTLEIHLATGFQNLVYETMPKALKNEIYTWLKETMRDEWLEGWSEEQFIYRTRKKALGPFKEKLWRLSEKEKKPIRKALEKQLSFLFEKLHIFNTREITLHYLS